MVEQINRKLLVFDCKKYIIIFGYLVGQLLFCQSNQDARMLGLNGTYTTLAKGFRSVGINPANLSIYKKKSWNIIDFSMGLTNNYFSIDNYNTLSGANLEDTNDINYYPKENIINEFGGKGLRIMQSLNIPIQPLNMSTGRFALTSRLTSNLDLGLSDGMVQFLFSGNPLERDIYFDMEEIIISIHELGISYGFLLSDFAFGITLKYLSGLFYMGMEPISLKTISTDSHGLHGNPQYLIRQEMGGKGIGLDMGILTYESDEGIRFGMSLINFFGNVTWTKNNTNQLPMNPISIWGSHLLGPSLNKISKSKNYLRPNEFMVVNFVLDSITATSFSEDSLMYYEIYNVMPVNSINNIPMSSQDSGLVITLDNDTFLYPSGGTYRYVDLLGDGDTTYTISDNYSQYSIEGDNTFQTRQPIYLRMGVSKRWEGQAIIAADLVTGFANRYGSSTNWRLSLGTEITRFKNKYLRMGYAFGGREEKSLSFGYGIKKGKLYYDIGLSLNGGFSLNSAKGFDLATGIIWQLD